MLAMNVGEARIPLKDNGHLANFDDWTPEVAKAMAEEDGMELTDCHWVALEFIRDYYRTYEIPPSPHTMIKEVGSKLHPYKCTQKTLEQMFPKGGCRHACRLAGLPEYICYSC